MAPLLELEHLFDAQRGFVRPLREGRETVKNLVFVGVGRTEGSDVYVEAMCLLTSAIHEEPTQIKIVIDKAAHEIGKKIKSIECGCKAGASKEHICKHGMAALIYLERNDEEELENLTCTDREQVWGKLKDKTLEQYNPVPLRKLCHVAPQCSPYRRCVADVLPDLEVEFRALLMDDRPSSEASVFRNNERQPERRLAETSPEENEEVPHLRVLLTDLLSTSLYLLKRVEELSAELLSHCDPEVQAYYEDNVKITQEEAIDIAVKTVGQDNELWEKTRFGKITGSICYSLYTYSKNKNATWSKKFDSIFHSTFQGNKDTERGLMFEPDARDLYKKMKKCDVLTPGVLVNPLVPWLGYSPDGLVMKNGRIDGLWECKTPAAGLKIGAADILDHLPYINKDKKLKHKDKYYGQIQLGMLLSGQSYCDFSIYCCGSDELHVETVLFNESFCSTMLESLANVYYTKLLPWICTASENNV